VDEFDYPGFRRALQRRAAGAAERLQRIQFDERLVTEKAVDLGLG